MAPQIQDYTSPVKGLQASEMGPNALRQTGAVEKSNEDTIGRSIGGAVSNIGQMIQKRQDIAKQNELQQGSAAFAMEDLSFTQDWETALGTGDPAKQQAVIDAHNANLDTLVSTAKSPEAKAQFAAEAARQKSTHFKSVTADQAQQAGAQAVASVNTYSAASVGIVSLDPTRLDDTLAHVAATVDSMVPAGADPATRAASVTDYTQKVQQATSHAAIAAMINKNPTDTLAKFKAGYFDKYVKSGQMSGADYASIPDNAQTEVNQQKAASGAGDAEQARQDRSTFDSLSTALVGATIVTTPGHAGETTITPDYFQRLGVGGDIYNAAQKVPGGAAELNTLNTYGQKILADKQQPSQAPTTDPSVYSKLKAEVITGQLTGQEGKLAVLNQFNGSGPGKNDGGLSEVDANELINGIDAHDKGAAADPAGAKIIDNQLNSALGAVGGLRNSYGVLSKFDRGVLTDETDQTKVTTENAYRDAYQKWFNASYSNARAAGKSPNQLLDPTSPDYLPGKYTGPGAGEIKAYTGQAPLTYQQGPGIPPPPASAGTTTNSAGNAVVQKATLPDGSTADPNDVAAASKALGQLP